MANKTDTRVREKFDSLMEKIDEPYGPNMAERDLQAALAFYLNDGARWRAFQAISLVANKIIHDHGIKNENFDGIHPETLFSVPWWAIRAIELEWGTFSENIAEGEVSLTLGKAFEVERPQQGKLSLYEQNKINMRDMRLATLVAQKGPPVDLAIKEVAEEGGLSERTVMSAWSSYKVPAKKLHDINKKQDKNV